MPQYLAEVPKSLPGTQETGGQILPKGNNNSFLPLYTMLWESDKLMDEKRLSKLRETQSNWLCYSVPHRDCRGSSGGGTRGDGRSFMYLPFGRHSPFQSWREGLQALLTCQRAEACGAQPWDPPAGEGAAANIQDNFPTPKEPLSSKQSGAWKSEVLRTAVRLLHVTAECLWLQNLLEDTVGIQRSWLQRGSLGKKTLHSPRIIAASHSPHPELSSLS